MNADRTIRVLVVDDDALLRQSLTRFLTLSGFAVTAVGDSLSCYRELDAGVFDIAVIDLGLPDQRGETLIEYLRRNTALPIVVITARDTLDTRVDCYRTGADLFLGKPVNGKELAAAIGSLTARVRALQPPAPPMAAMPPWILTTSGRTLVSPTGQRLSLTAKEWALFTTLAGAPGLTIARKDLLAAIYQRDDDSAQQALDTLLHRTRHKIVAKLGIPHPLLNEYGLGYRFAGLLRLDPES